MNEWGSESNQAATTGIRGCITNSYAATTTEQQQARQAASPVKPIYLAQSGRQAVAVSSLDPPGKTPYYKREFITLRRLALYYI